MTGFWNSLLFLQASTEVVTTKPAAVGWEVIILAIAVFTLPFVLGTLLANWLKLKDLGFKFGVVLFAAAISLTPFAYQSFKGYDWRTAIRLGIDLAGGTNLVYQIDTEAAKADGKVIDGATVEKLVQSIGKRLNPSGAEEITIRRVGPDRIEIIIPGADRDIVEQKKQLITRLGSLEFAILANQKDHNQLITRAQGLRPEQDEIRDAGRLVASWRTVAPGKEGAVGLGGGMTAVREVTRPGLDGKPQPVQQTLVVHEPPDRAVTGQYLTNARMQSDQNGQLAVGFTFNAVGGERFYRLTDRNRPDKEKFERRLAILLDGKVHSAPNLKEAISGGSGQITGQFTRKEVEELISVLNAGALEVPLITTPISEFTISPLLGADVQQKGITAVLMSALGIFVFITIYYRSAGIVADLCLVLTLILVIGAMAFIEATFTLPGLAGLVLTIGMAVDSNVLIYERMREELARGASLRSAIQNGFDKAWAAIIDSNVTTLITAVILWLIGTDQVKGFAVSLFIGLTAAMFAVLYFGHLCFEVMERKRWVTDLKFMQFIGTTKIDFLAKRVPAFALSAIVIIGGLASMYVRGKDNFDIDFTGGTMVTFEFTEGHEIADVRQRLSKAFPGAISVEKLTLSGEEATGSSGRRYRMRTTEQSRTKVREGINTAFSEGGFSLVRVTLEHTPPTLIAIATDSPDAASSEVARFNGGQESNLTFSGLVSEATATDYVAEALRSITKDGGATKYDAPTGLMAVKGVGTSTGKDKFKEHTLRVQPEVTAEDLAKALAQVKQSLATEPIFDELNSFDTSVAGETQINAIAALVLSLIAIVVYIWFRFEKLYFGYAAVAALAHDALVVIGSMAIGSYISMTPIGPLLGLEDFKINMGFIAAILTIIGYSLNDTIVIFDRIREIKGKNPNITYDMINLSVNQTLSRTILTALTVFIVVVVLYAFGGEGIHTFAYSFIVGVVTGTYSTVYIANPVLYWLVSSNPSPAKKAAA